jgi:hypothetical protein
MTTPTLASVHEALEAARDNAYEIAAPLVGTRLTDVGFALLGATDAMTFILASISCVTCGGPLPCELDGVPVISYTLAEIRHGTGWPKSQRFVAVPESCPQEVPETVDTVTIHCRACKVVHATATIPGSPAEMGAAFRRTS